jgi:hypothetical protein
MPSQIVAVEGGVDPVTGRTGNQFPIPVALSGSGSGSTVVANQGTPAATASAWPIKVTDGTNTAGIISNANAGNSIEVASGFVLGGVTINGASSNISGAGVDGGSARSNWTAFCFPTGTLTGNLSMELSDDGGNWVPSGTTVTGFTVATNLGMYSTGRAARYARVNLTGSSGTGTITIRMMAAG